MSKTNVKKETKKVTHEGMKAKKMTPYEALRRSVLSCMLFENTFYKSLVKKTARSLASRMN